MLQKVVIFATYKLCSGRSTCPKVHHSTLTALSPCAVVIVKSPSSKPPVSSSPYRHDHHCRHHWSSVEAVHHKLQPRWHCRRRLGLRSVVVFVVSFVFASWFTCQEDVVSSSLHPVATSHYHRSSCGCLLLLWVSLRCCSRLSFLS